MDTLRNKAWPWMILTALLACEAIYLQWQLIHRPTITVEKRVEVVPLEDEEEVPLTGPSAYELSKDVLEDGDPQAAAEDVLEGPRHSTKRSEDWKRTRAQGVMLARLWVSELKGMLGPQMVQWLHDRGTPPLSAHLLTHAVLNNDDLVVRETRKRVGSWLEVMRELSPHVTSKYDPKRPRQEWTSTLPAEGREAPSGWVPERDGDWKLYAESWELLREAAVTLWTSHNVNELAHVPGGGVIRAWDMEGNHSRRERLCKLDNGSGKPLAAGGNWFWGYDGDPACLPEPESRTIRVATMLGEM